MRYGAIVSFLCFIIIQAVAEESQHEIYKGYDNFKKHNVAVSDFVGHGLDTSEVFTLTDAFRSYLVNMDRFRIMERGQMVEIMREQGFQESGACTDQECMVEMGQLLGVDKIIAGSIGKVGETYSLNVRMISVQTGEIVRTVNKFHKGKIDVLLTEVLKETAYEISKFGKRTAPRPMESVVQRVQPPDEKQKKRKRKKHRPLLWVGLSTVIAGGGVAAYIFLNQDKKKADEPSVGAIEITW